MTNFFSSTTIWLVIAVSAERLIGIKYMLRRNILANRINMKLIISIIIFVNALINCYHSFGYYCLVKSVCGESQIISKCFDVTEEEWPGKHKNIYSEERKNFIKFSSIFHILFVSIIPIVLLFKFNIDLIRFVRKETFYNNLKLSFKYRNKESKRLVFRKNRTQWIDGVENATAVPIITNLHQRHTSTNNNFESGKFTFIICMIVTCFSITNLPSAIMRCIHLFFKDQLSQSIKWEYANTVSNLLIITGKMLNCVLFCLNSKAFRKRCAIVFKNYFADLHLHHISYINHKTSANESSSKTTELTS
uniref:G_PROTEIN_RECEP_F1_2 domain-containing protein n=1 Tax=Rhabditophanes sp. KR3021 TaxID=114890 RepID=A0AC35TJF2_9BILA